MNNNYTYYIIIITMVKLQQELEWEFKKYLSLQIILKEIATDYALH